MTGIRPKLQCFCWFKSCRAYHSAKKSNEIKAYVDHETDLPRNMGQ